MSPEAASGATPEAQTGGVGPDRAPRIGAVQIAELLRRPAPTPEQVAVIEAPLEPMLVVAGAGSGKTETMAARVVWLIANRLVAPEAVLGLTFTRKAAGELAERVQARLAQLARAQGRPSGGIQLLDRPTISTYNAYAASLVSDHALRLGLEPDARLLSEASQWQLAADVVESWAGDLDTDAAFTTVVGAVLSLSGALSEHLLAPAEARSRIGEMVEAIEALPFGEKRTDHYADVKRFVASLAERRRLIDVVEAYRERKRTTDSLDFGDQVAIAARLAREVPAVGQAERSRFHAVLLDEYQDTSYAQVELLAALFGHGHAVTAVGDPHQSIYGWRGASASGLARFPERFRVRTPAGTETDARVRYLSTSWRNDRAVLAAANVAAAPLRSGAVRVAVPELDERPGAGPGTVHAVYATTIEEEAAAVADFVAERWRPRRPQGAVDSAAGRGPAAGDARVGPAAGDAGAADSAAALRPGAERVTAAVLCRARSQFLAIEVALRARGLPVEVVGLGGLLSTPEVVDVVALLEAAHDPSRGDALVRLLTGPRVNLGAADLHALGSHAADLARRDRPGSRTRRGPEGAVVEGDVVDHRSIVDALDDLPAPGHPASDGRVLGAGAWERLGSLARVLRELRGHTYLSLPELVIQAERALGLDVEVMTAATLDGLARADGVDGSGTRGRAHLDAFRDVAATFAQSADTPTLGAFLSWLQAAGSRERGLDMPVHEPDPDAVQVITVHAAKGLEWDVVAVPGLVDGVFPTTAVGSDGPRDSGWTTGLGSLPFPLRGDAEDLPVLDVLAACDGKDLEERRRHFVGACGEHQVDEERRLAYVAFTRARRELLLSGSWWRGASRARPPSPFLTELIDAGVVASTSMAVAPEADEENPRAENQVEGVWPRPVEERRSAVRSVLRAAADHVRGRLDSWAPEGVAGAGAGDLPGRAACDLAGEGPGSVADTLPHPGELLDDDGTDLAELAWTLLAEREGRGARSEEIALPAHVSASGLVRLAGDRDDFARHLRRPVPARPSADAARGTRFHLWAERYFTTSSLLDPWDLPGADDDGLSTDLDLSQLQTTFLASEWAGRSPIAVEVDIETPVAGIMLRSRIDAVFPETADRAGGVEGTVVVVDWKTGRAPTDEAARRHREVQLAVYRLAWSRWSGLPLEAVHAAFYYIASDETVRPERLLGVDEIEALLRG